MKMLIVYYLRMWLIVGITYGCRSLSAKLVLTFKLYMFLKFKPILN